MVEKQTRAKYNLEFKMEAVKLVRNGQSSAEWRRSLGY